MDSRTFLENFGVIVEAPGGISRLNELILELAVRGALEARESTSTNEPIKWSFKDLKLDKDKIWMLPTAPANPSNGWNRIPLARLGTWGSGGTPTASRKDYYLKGTIPWAVIGDLNGGVLLQTESKITKVALESSSAKLVPIGAILIAMYGASIGKVAISGIKCSTNQAIAHCVPDQEIITPDYFLLLAKSLKNHLIAVGKGAAQPNISQTVLKHLMIDIPPIELQVKIVMRANLLIQLSNELKAAQIERNALLDTSRSSAINAISVSTSEGEFTSAWKRIQKNWSRFCDSSEGISEIRKLITELAVIGRLLPQSDSEQVNFPDVQLPPNSLLPKNWALLNFGQHCDIEGGNQPPKSTFVSEPKEGYVRLFQIRDLGAKPAPVYIPQRLARSMSNKGDILIGRYGASVGKIFYAQDGAYNVALVKFKYPKKAILPEFAYWMLQSTESQKLFTGMTRSAQAGFNKNDLAPLNFPLPPIAEQTRIVKKIRELMSECDELESQLNNRMSLAEKIAIASSLLTSTVK